MELEKQVCSLEFAKRLEKLGVKQDSHFHWRDEFDSFWRFRDDSDRNYVQLSDRRGRDEIRQQNNERYAGTRFYSAFTVAELGEMLPIEYISQRRPHGSIGSGEYMWHAGKADEDYSVEADTEADARAKMLIHLLEHKLIP